MIELLWNITVGSWVTADVFCFSAPAAVFAFMESVMVQAEISKHRTIARTVIVVLDL